MVSDAMPVEERDGVYRGDVRAARRISAQSVIWTVLASMASVVVGFRSGTAVLVAFGAIGMVDAVGSVALWYHFHCGLHHGELSDRRERLAHRVVLAGLLGVGCAAVGGGFARLAHHDVSENSDLGVALAAVSLVALVGLSARKRQIARRVFSAALLSDGHLSAVGALQASVTLAGTAVVRRWGWTWADAIATCVVGCVAVTLAITTWRAEDGAAFDLGTGQRELQPASSTRTADAGSAGGDRGGGGWSGGDTQPTTVEQDDELPEDVARDVPP
jgi:divalent metal cation (Fe/Co/Zn/Cd) transporter